MADDFTFHPIQTHLSDEELLDVQLESDRPVITGLDARDLDRRPGLVVAGRGAAMSDDRTFYTSTIVHQRSGKFEARITDSDVSVHLCGEETSFDLDSLPRADVEELMSLLAEVLRSHLPHPNKRGA